MVGDLAKRLLGLNLTRLASCAGRVWTEGHASRYSPRETSALFDAAVSTVHSMWRRRSCCRVTVLLTSCSEYFAAIVVIGQANEVVPKSFGRRSQCHRRSTPQPQLCICSSGQHADWEMSW